MKKFKILTKPTPIKDFRKEDWYEELNNAWELKVERLRARQGRRLKQQTA